MSNNFKKLAYVSRAMKKLAATPRPNLGATKPTVVSSSASGPAIEGVPFRPRVSTGQTPPGSLYNGLTEDQLRANIDNYQKRMIRQHMKLNRVGKDEAEKYYQNHKSKNRWYDTSNMAALREQMANNRRLREIATGERQGPKWSTPLSVGHGSRNRGQSYEEARASMAAYRRAVAEKSRNRDNKQPQPDSFAGIENGPMTGVHPGMVHQPPQSIVTNEYKPPVKPIPGPANRGVAKSPRIPRMSGFSGTEPTLAPRYKNQSWVGEMSSLPETTDTPKPSILDRGDATLPAPQYSILEDTYLPDPNEQVTPEPILAQGRLFSPAQKPYYTTPNGIPVGF